MMKINMDAGLVCIVSYVFISFCYKFNNFNHKRKIVQYCIILALNFHPEKAFKMIEGGKSYPLAG
jgi:hypothetical protein